MKKIFLSFGLLLGIASANAQSFGIKGGLNIANLHSDNSSSFDSRADFHIGALAHIHLSKFIAFQPEVMYSGQGAELTVSGNELKYKLSYINVPVLFQYMAGHGVRFETGPQLGFLTSAKVKSGGNSSDIKSSFNTTDFSWALGAGYLTTAKIGFDARYNFGINDIAKSNSDKVHNNVFQVGAFYQF